MESQDLVQEGAITIAGASFAESSLSENRKSVKQENLSPKDKLDMLQNRKHKIESRFEASHSLELSPSTRSPVSKQLRFHEATGKSEDLLDSSDC